MNDDRDSRKEKQAARILGYIFMFAGFGVFLWGAITVESAWRSKSWPSVYGEILQTEVKSSGKVSYPYVLYRYAVNEESYENDVLMAGLRYSPGGESAHEIVRRLKKLKQVGVYYNPKDPSKSVLAVGVNMGLVMLTLIGLLFLIAGVYVYQHGRVRKQPGDFREDSKSAYTPIVQGVLGFSIFVIFMLIMAVLFIPNVRETLMSHGLIDMLDNSFHEETIVTRENVLPSAENGEPVRSGDDHEKHSGKEERQPAAVSNDDRQKKLDLYKTAGELHKQALPFMRKGRYAEAEPLLRRRLSLARDAGDLMLRSLPAYMNDLAYVLRKQKRFEEAEQLYEQSLSISGKAPEARDLRAAVASEGLAAVKIATERYDGVETLYDQAIDIWDQIRGPGNPNSLSIMRRKASLYEKQGRIAEAAELREKTGRLALLAAEKNQRSSKAGSEKKSVKSSPEISERQREEDRLKRLEYYNKSKQLKNEALSHMRMREWKKAEPILRDLLILTQNAGDFAHRFMASYINDLAYVLREQGRLNEAKALYEKSLELSRADPKEKDIGLAVACEGLVKIKIIEGNTDGIENLYEQAIEIWDQVRGENNGNSIGLMRKLAEFYESQSHKAEAESLRNEINKRRKAIEQE